MERNTFNVTKSELDTITARTEDVITAMRSSERVRKGLARYAVEHGFSDEEARETVDRIIRVVDEYNRECRDYDGFAAEGGDTGEWISRKIAERVHGLSLEDECRFKLGVLMALRGASRDTVARVSEGSAEDMDTAFDELTEDEMSILDSGEFTPDILAEIDEALVDAVQNSGIEAGVTDRVAQLLDGEVDPDSVHGFVTELWHDEQLKYAASMAVLVARREGALPSVPEDTDDDALIIGACRGIDVANIEARVASGEMSESKAYTIIKAITMAGFVVLVGGAFITLTALVCAAVGVLAFDIFSSGLVASVVATVVTFGMMYLLHEDLCDNIEMIADGFEKVIDFSYDKLRKAAKAVAAFTRESVVPKAKELIANIGEFFGMIVSRVRSFFTQTSEEVYC